MNGPVHIHLDPLGGIAGDMFVAALLDAWPEHAEGAIASVRAAGIGKDIDVRCRRHRDALLVGSRFSVARDNNGPSVMAGHDHRRWGELRGKLAAAPLDEGTRERAIAIFTLLAEAEAWVHGVETEQVTLHEVGAWDSIADIVAAAFLIETIGAERWSVGSLPLGGGRVRCAHGELPVPAPAAARLLEGYAFHDDGRSGERVTPTGAAILKHLAPSGSHGPSPQRLLKTGHGFGLRRLEGMSNVLRVLAFDTGSMPEPALHDCKADGVAVVSFEVDDQTPEDLAIGLDRLRNLKGVLDVLQAPVFSKKGRLSPSLRLLVRPDALDPVISACFAETTTLGVRWRLENRAVLARSFVRGEGGVGVKLAERPGGRITAKAESDDLAPISGHAARSDARRSAEDQCLSRNRAKEDDR